MRTCYPATASVHSSLEGSATSSWVTVLTARAHDIPPQHDLGHHTRISGGSLSSALMSLLAGPGLPLPVVPRSDVAEDEGRKLVGPHREPRADINSVRKWVRGHAS